MERDGTTEHSLLSEPESELSEVAHAAPDDDPTPEDLLCLQSALASQRTGFDSHPQHAPPVDEAIRSKLQHTEAQLREAVEQIEALKRSANAVRARLEAEAHTAKKRAEQASEALQRRSATAETLRVANAELTTALEATQWRLADLETEGNVHEEEITRLQCERAAEGERGAALEAELYSLRQTLEHQPDSTATLAESEHAIAVLRAQQVDLEARAPTLQDERDQLHSALATLQEQHASAADVRMDLERQLAEVHTEVASLRSREADTTQQSAELQRQQTDRLVEAESHSRALADQLAASEQHRLDLEHHVTTWRAAQADELGLWQQTATEREAELVAARDELARLLEEEQSALCLARDEAGTLAARVQGLEAELLVAAQRHQELNDELAVARDEAVRERALFESAAHEREGQHRRALDELQREQTTFLDRLGVIEAERDAALQRRDDLEQQLEGAIAEHHKASAALESQHAAERTTLAERSAALEQQIEQAAAAAQQLQVQRNEALTAAAAAKDQLETDLRGVVERLQQALDATAQEAAAAAADRRALTERITMLEQAIDRRQAEISQLTADAEQQRSQHGEALAAAAAAKDQLEAERRELVERFQQELDTARQREAAACAERGALTERIAALDAALAQREAEIAQLTSGAQHLRDQHREAVQATAAAKGQLAAELRSALDTPQQELLAARTEAADAHSQTATAHDRVRALEVQLEEATQRHTAAVNHYMEEQNQRAETLRERQIELQKVTEELALTKQACEDAVAQLAARRHEADASAATPAAAPEPRKSAAPPVAATARSTAGKAGRAAGVSGPITVIHLEENTMFRDPVRDIVSRLPDARYLNTLDLEHTSGIGIRMLAVNLLNRAHDPLTAIASVVEGDTDPSNVFAYCADGSYGFSFGAVDFFTQPVDPDTCVARLLETRGTIDRLMAVSENLDMTGALRAALLRIRCSVSVALDLRQVLDLLPMIDPNVLVIDLTLPRGDGLRLINRLRADPKTRELPLAILLPPTTNVAEFRQYALRAARESPLSPNDLAQALGRRLGAPLSDAAARAAAHTS